MLAPVTRCTQLQVQQGLSCAAQRSAALIYRLSGDTNPLHADADFAQAAGFERPILHGLCTLGMAVKHVLQCLAGDNLCCSAELPGKRVHSTDAPRHGVHWCLSQCHTLQGRFAKHVFPGETLQTQMWVEGPTRVAFQTRVLERDAVVLKAGSVTLKQGCLQQPLAGTHAAVQEATQPGSLVHQQLSAGLGSTACVGDASAAEGKLASKL